MLTLTPQVKRQNMLRAVRFEKPDYIPMTFHINAACWQHYNHEALFDLMESHPFLFPTFVRPSGAYTPAFSAVARKDTPFRDDFGCLWSTSEDGITGSVVEHPLADWRNFDTYRFPDPDTCMGIGPVDWTAEKARVEKTKSDGGMTAGGLRHGHTFLQLCDIRGYEDLLCDMIDEEPLLDKLVEGVEAFNMAIVKHWLDTGVEFMYYPEDLGMQLGPMLSPDSFKRYIKPSYKRMMKPARDKGAIIHMHSDGDIRLFADDLIDGGVEVLNLQDLVNGIDWIRDQYKGKVCIDLDIDRQVVTPFKSPKDIDELIRTEVSTLGSKDGGLTMIYGLYPGVPLENARALMDAMEKYAFFYN